MSQLDKTCVMVLNRNYLPVHVTTPRNAFGHMASGVATALLITEGHYGRHTWDEWIKLPVNDTTDDFVRTPRGRVLVPRVILAEAYDRFHWIAPNLSLKALREQARGRCDYTGEEVSPADGSMDHYVPRSRGGSTSWDNLAYTSKRVNNRKGALPASEAGLRLRRPLRPPVRIPVMVALARRLAREGQMHPAHEMFLKGFLDG